MKEIIVKSQAEFDAIPNDFNGRIFIEFGTPYNRAVVNRVFQRASVVARENSSVVARENSSVEARGNSSVVARGNSSVVARENSSVVARGNSQICDRSYSHKITASGNARVVYDPQNIDEYCDHYQIERTENTAKLYKAVHKKDGRYFSDRDDAFEYVIGEEAAADGLTKNTSEDCGKGIHMAHKAWCVDYGKDWSDLAIIEVEADADSIIVPTSGCGKVRAAKVKVLREVPLSECGLLGKLLEKRRNNGNG